MRRFILGLIIVIVSAGLVFAGQYYTASGTTAEISLPKERGWPTINAVSFTATNATGDVTVYGGDSTEVVISAGKAATATTFIVDTCVGMDDDDIIVIQQTPAKLTFSDPVLESASMSSCVGTTLVMTLAAGTANDYNGTNGIKVYEMQPIAVLTDVGASEVNYTSGPIWGGRNAKPMAVRITDGTVNWLSGEWR